MRKRDREFIREVLREQRLISDRRFDQTLREIQQDRRAFRGEMRELREDMRELREDMREHFAQQDRKIDEVVAEGRAQRAALFEILDRLDSGGGAATA